MGFPDVFCKTPEAVAPFLLQVLHHGWLQHLLQAVSSTADTRCCFFTLLFMLPEWKRKEIVVLVPFWCGKVNSVYTEIEINMFIFNL